MIKNFIILFTLIVSMKIFAGWSKSDCNQFFHAIASAVSALEYESYPLGETFKNMELGESLIIEVPVNIKNEAGVSYLELTKHQSGNIGIKVFPKKEQKRPYKIYEHLKQYIKKIRF